MINSQILYGAIAGDIIGSRFEWHPVKHTKIELFHPDCYFTDDSVLTIAVADAILGNKEYKNSIWNLGNRYPNSGYGGSFKKWLSNKEKLPYNSFGNGSAMRVSAVGWAFDSEDEVLEQAKLSAVITHNHPEGIKGAQSTALAIFMSREGKSKKEIKCKIETMFGYDLSRSLAEIRSNYSFDVTCQGSVPESIIAFLESDDYESAVRNAISLGGDADTQAAISGSIAEAFYGYVSERICEFVNTKIPKEFKQIISKFNDEFH